MIEQSMSIRMCSIHSKETDLVCMQHNCFICYDCALFGAHQTHSVQPWTELEEEVKEKTAALDQIISDVDIAIEGTFQQVGQVVENRRQSLLALVQGKFEVSLCVIDCNELILGDHTGAIKPEGEDN